jgi:hypothetical protein
MKLYFDFDKDGVLPVYRLVSATWYTSAPSYNLASQNRISLLEWFDNPQRRPQPEIKFFPNFFFTLQFEFFLARINQISCKLFQL